MEQVSTYWLASEIRKELDLPVAPKTPELYINPAQHAGDSMATYNVLGLMGEYFHERPQANQDPEPQPIAEDYEAVHHKLQALTQANLDAYQVHLHSQVAQPLSFHDFAARCPPPGHQWYPVEAQYSQYDGGANDPTGFHWDVGSSKLSAGEFDEERPVTVYDFEGTQLKRAWEDGYETARKRFCNADHFALPVEESVVDDLADLFPMGWELPPTRPIQPTTFRVPGPEVCQAYWDDWQPEAGYEHYHYADVDFEGLPDFEDMMEMESELPCVQELEREIPSAQAWFPEHVMLPPTSFEPYYEEQQHLALPPTVYTPIYVEGAAGYVESPLAMTPMFNDAPNYPPLTNQLPNVPFPAVNAGWTKPVSERPTPPWRKQGGFEDGETLRNQLLLPPTRFLRMQALDLLHEFEERPIPDIADILPLKQQMRPAQEDILNWKFFSQRLPLAQRRGRQVQHLKLFWNSKATHDVHPEFHDTQALRAC